LRSTRIQREDTFEEAEVNSQYYAYKCILSMDLREQVATAVRNTECDLGARYSCDGHTTGRTSSGEGQAAPWRLSEA